MNYHFDWTPIWAHRDILLSGFALTVVASVYSALLVVDYGGD